MFYAQQKLLPSSISIEYIHWTFYERDIKADQGN